MIKECVVCGKEFRVSKHLKKTCSKECSEINHKNVCLKNYHKKRETPVKKDHYEKPKFEDMDRLTQRGILAREAGMTYGQYMTKMYLEKEKRSEKPSDDIKKP